MIFMGLLNFLSRLRHPRAYAEHQRRVAELGEHLDHHKRPASVVGCRACDERDGRVSELAFTPETRARIDGSRARIHMDCFSATSGPFVGCVVGSPNCPHGPH